jgi:transcription antitermination protein NusB
VTVLPRHQAREAALQALYFCEVSGATPREALAVVFAEHLPEAGDEVRAFAATLANGALGEASVLDPLIQQHAVNWRLERMSVVDRIVLRIAAWELRHPDPETPAAVVINEALELARTFSGDEAVPFVNGVLDAMRKTIEGHVERS